MSAESWHSLQFKKIEARSKELRRSIPLFFHAPFYKGLNKLRELRG